MFYQPLKKSICMSSGVPIGGGQAVDWQCLSGYYFCYYFPSFFPFGFFSSVIYLCHRRIARIKLTRALENFGFGHFWALWQQFLICQAVRRTGSALAPLGWSSIYGFQVGNIFDIVKIPKIFTTLQLFESILQSSKNNCTLVINIAPWI